MKKISKKLNLIFLISVLWLFSTSAFAYIGPWQNAAESSKAARIRLLGSKNQDGNFLIGVDFKLEKGWHIYGNGSEGLGLPPSFDFLGSENYVSHKISWPKAIVFQEKIGDETIKYQAYENEVILPLEIQVKDKNKPLNLNLKITYGLCKDVCIPATSTFNVLLEEVVDEDALALIQKKSLNENVADEKSNLNPLFYAIFAAIFGGLILNIMPCVLPVLGIKLMSIIKEPHPDFANNQDQQLKRIRFSFFSSILGILFCFTIFALFAIFIKFTGNVFNWGLQFQNPYFLIFLIAILTFLSANIFGLFELNFDSLIANLINRKIDESTKKHHIFAPNFLSGILAVLLATPCSAPFLGSAISFSITQNSITIFAIFIAMAFGFALPYIALIASPRLIDLMPKPGQWMRTIKNIMGILLLATLLWLLYVLSGNIGFNGAVAATFICALIFIAFKIKYKSIKTLLLLSLLVAIFALPKSFKHEQNQPLHPYDLIFRDFDELKLHQLISEGKTVVVDVTANWCITCKFNKITVLHDKEVMDKLDDEYVYAMRANITKPNEEVLNFIHKKGRYAIPFNAVYGPCAKEGFLTSELLTKKELVRLIDEASCQ